MNRENEAKNQVTQITIKLEETKALNSNLTNALNSQEKKIKELQRMINDLNDNKRNFIDELKVRMNEIEELKKNLSVQSSELQFSKQQRNKIAELEKSISDLQNVIEQRDNEIADLKAKQTESNQTIESLNKSFDSLHHINEESQLRCENIARKYDVELVKIKSLLEREKTENENLKTVIKSYTTNSKEIIELKKQLNDKKTQNSVLEMEKKELEKELSEILTKLKTEGIQKEFYIDKRVITKFLLSYFDLDTTYPVKVQILETLSSILELSDEDRKKMGLQKNTLIAIGEADKMKKEKWLKEEGEKLPDKLLDFLMNDEED